MSYAYKQINSPVGPLHLVADDKALRVLTFEKTWPLFKNRFSPLEKTESAIINEAERQLEEYFEGTRRAFDLPLHLSGTPFQNKAWTALKKIPFGKTASYKQQAEFIDNPKAIRAIGHANGLNPLCIVLPCHRVVGSNGELTGFGGGLPAKAFLLKLEGSRP